MALPNLNNVGLSSVPQVEGRWQIHPYAADLAKQRVLGRLNARERYRKSSKGRETTRASQRRLFAALSREQRNKRNAVNKAERHKLRYRAFELLGGKCQICGESDWRVLQLDHANPTSRMRYTNLEQELRIRLREKTAMETYYLLCANCHVRKTRVNGEYNQGRWED